MARSRRSRRIRQVHRLTRRLTLIAILALVLFGGYVFTRSRPQDMPWTKLDLGQPIGLFTWRKVAALADDPGQCRTLLGHSGAGFDAVDPFGEGQCRVEDGLKLAGGSRRIVLQPDNPSMACPVAVGMAMWEWNVVQPAAQRIFGQKVEVIDQLGVWNCRRIAGSQSMSQHATADALDVAGFRLADGTRITLLGDWNEGGKKAQFLREVRDGACGVFATVLSPDYNAAHADHFHLDQARREGMSWRSCR